MGKVPGQTGVVDETKGLLVSALDPAVTIVRCKSFPYPWLLRELFDHASQVQTLIVSRRIRERLEHDDVYRGIFAEHPVTIASSAAVGKKRIGFKKSSYKERQAFMLSLDEERQTLFDELLAFNSVEAEVTSRYFCLNGEEYLPPSRIANIFGCSQGGLQIWVGMVLCYLDAPLALPKQAISYTFGLKKRIVHERERLKRTEVHKQALAACALKSIPAGMPLRFLEVYALVYRAWECDQLSELTVSASERSVLIARYGLEGGSFKTLDEVGIDRGLTRQRIRQIEASGLRKLRAIERDT